MKKIIKLFFVIVMLLTVVSCMDDKYPMYMVSEIKVIPDSLKEEHREYIKELVRAASQHMTGGDYEDVDVTIIQAKRIADDLYGVDIIVLRKYVAQFVSVDIDSNNFTDKEREIYNDIVYGQLKK